MKKGYVIAMSTLLLLSSCGSYEAAGAYTGAQFGSIIGSAVGGLTGGWRGSDVGTLVGMAGGAMVGAAIGKSADNAQQQKYSERVSRRSSGRDTYRQADAYDPSERGDDRITFDGGTGTYPGSSYAPATAALEIRNAHLIEGQHDGVLTRGEQARMVFEIYNPSSVTVYNVQPAVAEVTGNKHVHVSENILVESIGPNRGIRYTAIVSADKGLKDGQAVIRIGVLQGHHEVTSQRQEFRLVTRRK